MPHARRRTPSRSSRTGRPSSRPSRSSPSSWSSAASLVLVVSFGFGTIYARRALVPIRESLANQRAALRRQREFAADASHELRTPLTVIRSSVEHLERHRDEPVATVGSALEDIDDEVRHMTAIVEDLLLLARSDSGAVALERVPVDLGDVAADGASRDGQAGHRPRRPRRGRPAARGRRRRPGPTPPAGHDPGRQRHPPQPDRRARRRRGRGRSATARRSSSRTTGPGSGRRTCPTCSSGSTARRARPVAGPAWAWPSPPGSSTATAAGSRSRTGPRAAPGSWSACPRPAAPPADRILAVRALERPSQGVVAGIVGGALDRSIAALPGVLGRDTASYISRVGRVVSRLPM